SRRRHTRFSRDWSSDVCSSDLARGARRPSSWRRENTDRGALSRASASVVGSPPTADTIAYPPGPTMDPDEDELTGRRRRRRMIAAAVSLPFLGVMGFGVWFFLSAQSTARERTLVEQVTGAAFGCVASMRGDAPEPWGLERALEHMSRMERVTRDANADEAERERFVRLSTDAARGCEA